MKKFILPLTLILFLSFTLIGNCVDWLAGYDQRIKLTVHDADIDTANLTWFPVTVFLTGVQAEEIFTEFDADADYLKVAFTKSDGTTELYAECELFDDSESLGIYHVSRDGWVIAYDADTDFYMYYDNDHADNTTYIGTIDTTPGGNVWDGNFKSVYHLVDATTSTVKDSTSNNKDGTKTSANNPLETAGKVGQGQTFSTDKIATAGAYNDSGFTISFCSYPTNVTAGDYVFHGSDGALARNKRAIIIGFQSGYFNVYNGNYPTGTAADTQIAATVNTWQHIAYGSDGTNVLGYKNGAVVINVSANLNCSGMADYDIGAASVYNEWYLGILDEVRISNTLRSASWNKATYNSLEDSLLTYGSEESAPAEGWSHKWNTITIGKWNTTTFTKWNGI